MELPLPGSFSGRIYTLGVPFGRNNYSYYLESKKETADFGELLLQLYKLKLRFKNLSQHHLGSESKNQPFAMLQLCHYALKSSGSNPDSSSYHYPADMLSEVL